MSRKLLYLLGILLTILIGTLLHWLLNCNCGQKSGAALSESSEQSIAAMPTVVPDTSGQYALVKFRERYNTNPLVLYYPTGKSEIILTAEEQQRVAEIAGYMNKVPGAVVTITGHADNIGDKQANVLLAMDRARFAGSKLVEGGVPESRTELASRGPDEPAADNGTPEGRALNRRTVILIK